MTKKLTSLMAVAMAGIISPEASAAVFQEPPDFSSNSANPTVIGDFDPDVDSIIGTVSFGDSDHLGLNGEANASLTLPFTTDAPEGTVFNISILDDPQSGFITSAFFNGSGSSSITFNVPVDGDFVLQLFQEGAGSVNYTIGVVPEPSTFALLATGVAGAMLLRQRRNRERDGLNS